MGYYNIHTYGYFDCKTIIEFRWIITAGHCLHQRTDIYASFGISENGKFHEHITVNASNVFIHPGYIRTADIVANDIGW